LAPVNVLDQPPRRVDSIAHDLYLQGRYYASLRSRDGLEKSIEALSQAVGKDPQYAAAYAALADTYNLIAFYGFDPSMNAVSRAKIAADHALSLDGSLAAAHAALGYTEFMWRQDWSAADREFRRAIELDDNYVPAHQWYALYLAALGRMDQSLQQIERALRLDPLSPPVHATMGYMYYLDRDYPHAIEQAKEALHLDPNLMVAHAVLGWAYTEQGSYSAAIEELQTSVRLSKGAPIYLCTLGRAYALSGNLDEARRIASQVGGIEKESRGSGAALSALFLALGNPEDALRWLEETAPGDIQANWLRVEPAFDPLRGNPRFEAVVRRIEMGQR
jgi:tetratricopeptide (TPR) repeat protein